MAHFRQLRCRGRYAATSNRPEMHHLTDLFFFLCIGLGLGHPTPNVRRFLADFGHIRSVAFYSDSNHVPVTGSKELNSKDNDVSRISLIHVIGSISLSTFVSHQPIMTSHYCPEGLVEIMCAILNGNESSIGNKKRYNPLKIVTQDQEAHLLVKPRVLLHLSPDVALGPARCAQLADGLLAFRRRMYDGMLMRHRDGRRHNVWQRRGTVRQRHVVVVVQSRRRRRAYDDGMSARQREEGGNLAARNHYCFFCVLLLLTRCTHINFKCLYFFST